MSASKTIVSVFLILLILSPAALLIYSDTWPPVYTVESESMEHSNNWTLGTINVGDIVFVKSISDNPSNVVTFIQGKETGYTSYGDFGNVILYMAPSHEIIIHRAMFYLSWSNGKPVVSGFSNQTWVKVTENYVLIDNASYTHRNLIVYLHNLVNKSGFITVGDYNLANSQLYNSSLNAYAAADQNVFGYNPANPSSVIGIAFGQVPWFGLIKLNLMRVTGGWTQYGQVPNNAYLYLIFSVVIVVSLILFPYDRLSRVKKE